MSSAREEDRLEKGLWATATCRAWHGCIVYKGEDAVAAEVGAACPASVAADGVVDGVAEGVGGKLKDTSQMSTDGAAPTEMSRKGGLVVA